MFFFLLLFVRNSFLVDGLSVRNQKSRMMIFADPDVYLLIVRVFGTSIYTQIFIRTSTINRMDITWWLNVNQYYSTNTHNIRCMQIPMPLNITITECEMRAAVLNVEWPAAAYVGVRLRLPGNYVFHKCLTGFYMHMNMIHICSSSTLLVISLFWTSTNNGWMDGTKICI